MNDRGSVAPLVAGYLSLILLTIFGSAAVGLSMIATNRVQSIADAAVLFAHDRSITAGIPNQTQLKMQVDRFLQEAPSAKRILLESVKAQTFGTVSQLELCAKVPNPLWETHEISVCRQARAESFVIR